MKLPTAYGGSSLRERLESLPPSSLPLHELSPDLKDHAPSLPVPEHPSVPHEFLFGLAPQAEA